LLTKSITPSFIPKLSSDKYDVSHFDPEVTKQIATESVISDNTRKIIEASISPFKEEFRKIVS